MSRVLSCAFLLLIICGAVIAQQPPASAPWNVTLETGKVADSTLTVVNRCKKNHQFQIQTQNLPFLQLSANQVNVKGGQTQVLPVKFDTRNLPPGVHQGTVLVLCRTCGSEPTCTQDREVLQVMLTLTGELQTTSSASGTARQITETKSGPGPALVMARVDSSMVANQIVHVESNYGGSADDWVIEIKTQSGQKGFIHVRTEKRPDVKFCDWIKIGNAEDKGGSTWVDSIEKTEDPTKKPEGPKPGDTNPQPSPEPPKPPEPPKTPEPTPSTTPQPPRPPDTTEPVEEKCKEGEKKSNRRIISCEASDAVATELGYGPTSTRIFGIGTTILKVSGAGRGVQLGKLLASAFSSRNARHLYIKLKIKYVDEVLVCKDGKWVVESSTEGESETGWIQLFDSQGGGGGNWLPGSTGADVEAAIDAAKAANGCP
ncbi:MAG: hypothetical protein ACT4OT_06435 [Acidobacteriota bacterium]